MELNLRFNFVLYISVLKCNNRISHTFHDHEGILFLGDKDPNPSSWFVVFNSKCIINRWCAG
ncbi:hypothetical protein Hanom_Chr05g00446491 [Helianthus anomalus]